MQTIPMITKKIRGYDSIEIYPISDLHVGSKEFNEAEYLRTIREILYEPNRFVVLAGDYIDNGVKSSVTSPYTATMQPAAQRKYAAEILYPIRDRIICMTGGNHEARSIKDTDTDPAELIAERLEISDIYNPDICFVKIDLGERSSHSKIAPMYCMAVTHGSGGGMMLGAGLSKSESFALAIGADILITGHSHKPATAPTVRLQCDMSHSKMVYHEMRIMVATGYLDYGGYPTRKMLRPVALRQNKAILSASEYDIAVLS